MTIKNQIKMWIVFSGLAMSTVMLSSVSHAQVSTPFHEDPSLNEYDPSTWKKHTGHLPNSAENPGYSLSLPESHRTEELVKDEKIVDYIVDPTGKKAELSMLEGEVDEKADIFTTYQVKKISGFPAPGSTESQVDNKLVEYYVCRIANWKKVTCSSELSEKTNCQKDTEINQRLENDLFDVECKHIKSTYFYYRNTRFFWGAGGLYFGYMK